MRCKNQVNKTQRTEIQIYNTDKHVQLSYLDIKLLIYRTLHSWIQSWPALKSSISLFDSLEFNFVMVEWIVGTYSKIFQNTINFKRKKFLRKNVINLMEHKHKRGIRISPFLIRGMSHAVIQNTSNLFELSVRYCQINVGMKRVCCL